nr:ribonuclease H [Ipomoea batatas]
MRQTLELYVLNPDVEEEDDEVWMWEDSCKFTVRSAFLRTNPNNIDVQDAAWMDVWKIGVASRIRMFIWLVKHKKIPCNAERKKRHLTDYGNCLSCANAWEDTEHVIHKCLYARYVWAKLMSNQALSRLDTLCFSKWINTNVTSDLHRSLLRASSTVAVSFTDRCYELCQPPLLRSFSNHCCELRRPVCFPCVRIIVAILFPSLVFPLCL